MYMDTRAEGLQTPPHTCINLTQLGKQQLEQQIAELAAQINVANYRLLTLIARFDTTLGWGDWGCRSCAHWLNWRCGIALGAAREKVRTAHALEQLPKISEAFASGGLSYSKARALTRIATADNEADLLMFAQYGSASHVEKLVQQYRRVLSNEEHEAENQAAKKQHRNRKFNHYWDDDGYLVVSGKLSPEQGALFLKAMNACETALEQDEQHVPAGTPPPDDDEKDTPLEPHTPGRFENKRADAVTLLAESYLQSAPASVRTADRYQVVVHIDEASLCRNDANANGAPQHRCELEDGPRLASETVRRLCCDGSLVPATDEGIGRKSRSIPPAMRRSLQHRDKGCRFPGCTATHTVDGHHIQHWADGGETKLSNLVLLCRHHHRKVHEEGFGVSVSLSGDLHFTRPNGLQIPAAPVLPVPEQNLEELSHELGLDIDENTVFAWSGDFPDYGMAIDGLEYHRKRNGVGIDEHVH